MIQAFTRSMCLLLSGLIDPSPPPSLPHPYTTHSYSLLTYANTPYKKVTYSPNGEYALVERSTEASVFHHSERILTIKRSFHYSFSADSTHLVYTTVDENVLYHLPSLSKIYFFPRAVSYLQLSPSSAQVIASTYGTGSILTPEKHLISLPSADSYHFLSEDTLLLREMKGKAWIYSLTTQHKKHVSVDNIHQLLVSPDYTWYGALSRTNPAFECTIFDAQTHKAKHTYHLGYTPDSEDTVWVSNTIISADGSTILCSLREAIKTQCYGGLLTQFSFSEPDPHHYFYCIHPRDGTMTSFSRKSTLINEQLNPQGTYMAGSYYNTHKERRQACILDTTTGSIVRENNDEEEILFHPDGKRLLIRKGTNLYLTQPQ